MTVRHDVSEVIHYKVKGGDHLVTVTTRVEISAPIRLCFDLARDIEVHTKTVWKHTKEKAVMGVVAGPIELDQTVTFEAIHFLVKQRLTSKITAFNEPFLFVDEMQKGAFKKLKHIHEFEEYENKTIMSDTLTFQAPFGPIGWIVERLLLKRYMKRFLEHRNYELKKLAEELSQPLFERNNTL